MVSNKASKASGKGKANKVSNKASKAPRASRKAKPDNTESKVLSGPPDNGNNVETTKEDAILSLAREGIEFSTELVHIDKLLINPRNPRDAENLQPEIMEDQISTVGRILEPLMISPERGNLTMRGTRRLTAARNLRANPNTPKALKDRLEWINCTVVKGLTDAEVERIVNDHGEQLELDRVEFIKAVWRMQLVYMVETLYNVANHVYTGLARFTNKPGKRLEVQREKDPEKRKEILTKWARGTLADHLFKANNLGPRVRDQLILENMPSRRPLTDEEKARHTFKANRENVAKLAQARDKDLDRAKGGKGWNATTGGEHFNAQIRELEAEFKGEATASKRPSVKALKDQAGGLNSEAMQTTLMVCAGLDDSDLSRIDDNLYRKQLNEEVILGNLDKILKKEKLVADMFSAMIYQSPEATAKAVKEYLAAE